MIFMVPEVTASFLLLYLLFETRNIYDITIRKINYHTSYLYSDTQWKVRSLKCYAKCVEMFIFLQIYNFRMVKVIEQLNHGPPVFNLKIGERDDLLEKYMSLAWKGMDPIDRKEVLLRPSFGLLQLSCHISWDCSWLSSHVYNYDTFIGPVDHEEVLRDRSLWMV
jgi:hypothetical protein